MDESSNRSTTAEGAAFCRALGALERDPALRNPDHLARLFVTTPGWRLGLLPVVRRMARRDVERRVPGAVLLHHARTRVFDDLTRAEVHGGAAQLVILGAGADSRAYRFRYELADATVFEVDHPETGAWKRARVLDALGRLPDNVRYVPVDFGTDDLASALDRAGFDPTARTLFLWEGVCMYLAPEAVDAVLAFVSRSPAGSAVAFDFIYAESIAHPERFEGAPAHHAFVAAKGEPFLFGLDPDPRELFAFLAARGLGLTRSWDHRALRATYPGGGFLTPFVGVVHGRVGAGGRLAGEVPRGVL
jgi:methyltransferase (TIGR00027 family)